jgi:hypothetical protein
MQIRQRALVLVVLSALAPNVPAHHSPVAFDGEKIIRLDGVVSRFDWTNPHVYIYVETEDATGQTVEWQLESDWTNDLIRAGWTAESLHPGDRIRVQAHPAHNARLRYANLISLQKDDGTVLASWDLGERDTLSAPSSASGLAGRWLPDQGFPAFFRTSAERVNSDGAHAQEVYREEDNPGVQCTPHPLPTRLGMPHVNEIAIHDDRVIIASESDPEPRVVYTDGRVHPAGGEPGPRGYSIGYWDGDALNIDTALFSPNLRGNGFKIPSSSQKRLLERYELSEDGSELRLNYVLKDPVYFEADVSGTFIWRYAPDLDLIPYSCDLDVARRYLEVE